jgi:uncharacterized protein involved in exopolysaccharide biosynthesis
MLVGEPASRPQEPGAGVVPALSRAVRRVWLLGITVFVAVGAGVFGYAYSLPDEFTSTAYLSFDPRGSRQLSADSIQVFATKYRAFLLAPATLSRISRETGADREMLKDAVRVEIPPATVNMSVSVTNEDPRTAARLANTFASTAVQQAVADENLRAEVLSPGIVPIEPSGPPRHMLVVGGLVLGAGVAVLVVLALERLRWQALGAPGTTRRVGRESDR